MLLTFCKASYNFFSSSGRLAPVRSVPASCSVCNPPFVSLRSAPCRLASRKLAPDRFVSLNLTPCKLAPRRSARDKSLPERSTSLKIWCDHLACPPLVPRFDALLQLRELLWIRHDQSVPESLRGS